VLGWLATAAAAVRMARLQWQLVCAPRCAAAPVSALLVSSSADALPRSRMRAPLSGSPPTYNQVCFAASTQPPQVSDHIGRRFC
jgi:hypothetical protein